MPKPKPKPILCEVCKQPIHELVIATARERGAKQNPKYCSPRCRDTARKRRQRDGTAIPRAEFERQQRSQTLRNCHTPDVSVILGTLMDTTYACKQCGTDIPIERVYAAQSRGKEPSFCSPRCSDTWNKRQIRHRKAAKKSAKRPAKKSTAPKAGARKKRAA